MIPVPHVLSRLSCFSAALLAISALLAGCLSRVEVAPSRYFQPIAGEWPESSPAEVGGGTLCVQRVESPSYLAEAIAWRLSPVEIGFYDHLLWAQTPAWFLEKALAHELYVRRGWPHSDEREATLVLSVELLAFEEVLAPRHEARVAASFELRAGDRVLKPRTEVVISRPIASDQPEVMAAAMGTALVELVSRIADGIGQVSNSPTEN